MSGNRRYYDKSSVDLLKKIKFLLKDKGMTINGVKKILDSDESNVLTKLQIKLYGLIILEINYRIFLK